MREIHTARRRGYRVLRSGRAPSDGEGCKQSPRRQAVTVPDNLSMRQYLHGRLSPVAAGQAAPQPERWPPLLRYPREETHRDWLAEPFETLAGLQQQGLIRHLGVSNAVLFLASDVACHITGVQLRVDAGGYLKWYDFQP